MCSDILHGCLQTHNGMPGEAFNTDARTQERPPEASEGEDENDDGLFEQLSMFAPKGSTEKRWQPVKQSKWSPIHIWHSTEKQWMKRNE